MIINSLKVAENIGAIRELRKENADFYNSLIGKSFKTKYDYYLAENVEVEYDVNVLFYDEDAHMFDIEYSHPYYDDRSFYITEDIILNMILSKL